MSREERERLHDMLEAIDAIRSHAAVVDKASPELVRDAILYRLVVIGEAVKALPQESLHVSRTSTGAGSPGCEIS